LNYFNEEIATITAKGAESFGILLPSDAISKFQRYFEILEAKNKEINLTAITGAKDVAVMHFLDSIALLTTTDFKGLRVIDIGSGAGFPGVPLKITEPSIDITLLDSLGKRIDFLSELCAELEIDASCVTARAEGFACEGANRESFGIAVTRAVARLNILAELCLPLVEVGGTFIAMKSTDSNEEIGEAITAIETLGAEFSRCVDYKIPGTGIMHRAVVIKKVSETPEKYPRRFARIAKSPLK